MQSALDSGGRPHAQVPAACPLPPRGALIFEDAHHGVLFAEATYLLHSGVLSFESILVGLDDGLYPTHDAVDARGCGGRGCKTHDSETAADKIGSITGSALFRRVVITLIAINAIIVGLDTYPYIHAAYGQSLWLVDRIILYVFALELVLRFFASNPPAAFFRM